METQALIFITGGVRSGKSTFAEQLAIQMAMDTGGTLHYIATGVPSDSEMRKRIEKHQRERAESPIKWKTWEQSQHIDVLGAEFHHSDILLLDCLTTLLNNELFSSEDTGDEFQDNVMNRILTGVEQLRKNASVLILVSNEVLHDCIRDSELVLDYSRLIGKMHQQIVRKADQAYLIESGIPVLMKGEV